MAELYVGEGVDPAAHQRDGARTVLDGDDLTTHGVIVGMTGSGKTGLGVVLIEELLRAGIPVLMFDPKGDLGNLLLAFPQLRGEDFRPWIDEAAAAKEGITPDALAQAEADKWKEGLAGWGLGGDDIAGLQGAARFTIYTPGSTAGVPLDIVGSLRAPGADADPEAVHDEIDGYVAGLLGLVGIEADPLSSREHILLANLVQAAWSAGRDLDLPTLVTQVATPPLRKLGVFELDQFFPPKDRTALAMRLNGLLASPAFAAWAQGAPLDIEQILRPEGGPGAAIVSTAHLSDAERQFVTALVLGKLVTWMRRQSGTTGLRALVYMDEVAGYVPPTAMPPTKGPIMTLMKQARAFGVGMVLATQNPVDVDYKALSNAGTWMVGRLQTERDKARLLDGMRAAAGEVDVEAVGATISGLAKREFVLRRAGKDKPDVITTRWALCYLRGPLTKDQIATLMAAAPARTERAEPAEPSLPPPPPGAAPSTAALAPPSAAAPPGAAPAVPDASTGATVASAPVATAASGPLADDELAAAPQVAAGTPVYHLAADAPWAAQAGAHPGGTRLEAAAIARVRLMYDDTAADVRHTEEWEAVLHPLTEAPDMGAAVAVDYDDRDLTPTAPPGARFVAPSAPIDTKGYWTGLKKALVDHLAANRAVEVQRNRQLKLWSRVGETPESFANRCTEAASAGADGEAAKLRDKYEAKLDRARDALAKAEDRADVAASEAKGRRSEELLGGVGSVLGGFLGGRRGGISSVLRGMGTTAGRRSRATTSGQRAEAAQNRVEEAQHALEDLDADLAEELTAIQNEWQAKASAVETVSIPLERTDVSVVALGLLWLPVAG